MFKGPLKLLVLAVLAAGAANLPTLLGDKLEGSRLSAAGVPIDSTAENASELSRELAELPNIAVSMAAMEETYKQEQEQALEGLSPGEQEIMKEATQGLTFKSNKLTKSLGLAPGSKPRRGRKAGAAGGLSAAEVFKRLHSAKSTVQMFSDFRYSMFKFFKQHEAGITIGLWLVPAGIALLSFLLFMCKRYTLSMNITGLLFLVSNYLLWMLSTTVVFSAVLTKENLLAALPRQLWMSPVTFLVISAGLLRLADENYPFWNRTIAALGSPITAACVAAGWHRGFGLLKGALAARLQS